MSVSIKVHEQVFFGEQPQPIFNECVAITEKDFEEDIKEKPQSEDLTIIVAKYNRHRDIMAQANKKYREANKDKVNKIAKAYYDRHKDDDAWRKKQCEKSKRAYLKKKEKVKQENTALIIQL
jgi:hypothetical protein